LRFWKRMKKTRRCLPAEACARGLISRVEWHKATGLRLQGIDTLPEVFDFALE
jgi:hypothetical protein